MIHLLFKTIICSLTSKFIAKKQIQNNQNQSMHSLYWIIERKLFSCIFLCEKMINIRIMIIFISKTLFMRKNFAYFRSMWIFFSCNSFTITIKVIHVCFVKNDKSFLIMRFYQNFQNHARCNILRSYLGFITHS